MYTLDDFLKILRSLSGESVPTLDGNLKILSESERVSSRLLFEKTMDQICFASDDYKRLRKFLIDWYAAHKTLTSSQREISDLFSSPEAAIDKLLESFGFDFPTDTLSFLSKVYFFLDLVNLYKIKGTPVAIERVLEYFGFRDVDIAEYLLQKDENGNLVFRPVLINEPSIGELVVDWNDIAYSGMIVNDPHWMLSESQITTLINQNTIALPSKSPYFALLPKFYLQDIYVAMAIISRKVQDQFSEWQTTGTITERDIRLSKLGYSVSLLELVLACGYTFIRHFNADPSTTDTKFLCYNGPSLDDIPAIVEQFNELKQHPITRAAREANLQTYWNLFTRDMSTNFLTDKDYPAYYLNLINSTLKETIDDWFDSAKDDVLLAYLLRDLSDWILANIGFDFPRLVNVVLGDLSFIDIWDIINFFKPYRARLIGMQYAYIIDDKLLNSFLMSDSVDTTYQITFIDWATADSTACFGDIQIEPNVVTSTPPSGDYTITDIYVDENHLTNFVYDSTGAQEAVIIHSTPGSGQYRIENVYVEETIFGNKQLIVLNEIDPTTTPGVSTNITSAPPNGYYRVRDLYIDSTTLQVVVIHDEQPFIYADLIDSTARLYYSRETYDCGSFFDIGIATDFDDRNRTYITQRIDDYLNVHPADSTALVDCWYLTDSTSGEVTYVHTDGGWVEFDIGYLFDSQYINDVCTIELVQNVATELWEPNVHSGYMPIEDGRPFEDINNNLFEEDENGDIRPSASGTGSDYFELDGSDIMPI